MSVDATLLDGRSRSALHGVWFAGWILWNTAGPRPFDPFPFGLLTMVVSLEAIFLSVFVLISPNRQSAKDRVRSDIEYEVNVKANWRWRRCTKSSTTCKEQMVERLPRPTS